MSHIVDVCPLTTSEGGLRLIHNAEEDAVKWLESVATTALTSHSGTVVPECFKGDSVSQWKSGKFDPRFPKNP